jgi:hypothetical protein
VMIVTLSPDHCQSDLMRAGLAPKFKANLDNRQLDRSPGASHSAARTGARGEIYEPRDANFCMGPGARRQRVGRRPQTPTVAAKP